MTLSDYEKSLPDYYKGMHLDGYTPQQIYRALHKTMLKKYMKRLNEQEEVSEINITSSVKVKK